jgi:hypothetical protein
VSLEDNYLTVSGETVYNGSTYNTSTKTYISDKILSQIEAVDYEAKNGIVFIELKRKQEAEPKIPVTKVKKK